MLLYEIFVENYNLNLLSKLSKIIYFFGFISNISLVPEFFKEPLRIELFYKLMQIFIQQFSVGNTAEGFSNDLNLLNENILEFIKK